MSKAMGCCFKLFHETVAFCCLRKPTGNPRDWQSGLTCAKAAKILLSMNLSLRRKTNFSHDVFLEAAAHLLAGVYTA